MIAYAWVIWYKGFPETINLFRKLIWIKEDGSVNGKGVGRVRDPMLARTKAGVAGCPYTIREVS